ncbi:MAG: hypothetical protein J5877_01690 [Clostridia bacterium]|nr:hypothetical protein [Clostridia bacterium]
MAHKKGIPTGMPFYVGDSNDIVHLAAVRQWRSRKGHKIGYFAKQNCVKKENYLIIISD